VVTAFILLYAKYIKLNLQKKAIFWAAVIVEVIGMIVYVVHLFPQSSQILDVSGFLVFVTAFILLCISYIPAYSKLPII